MVDWLLTNSSQLLSGLCYFFAAVLAVWGAGSAGMKLIGDNHGTVRDVTTILGLAAVGATLLSLLGAYIPTLLSGSP
jgi:hypothetical protein